jgi:outer membrane protein TolC
MRYPTAALALFLSIGSLRAEAPPVQGTLPEDFLPSLKPILKDAIERSPATITASINLAVQEGSKLQDYSILYPQVGLGANYGINTAKTDGSSAASKPARGLYYSASASQAVFQWGAYKNTALIGKLGLKIAEKQYADAYRGLAISVREQYMALISKKVIVRNEEFKLKIANEEYAAQKARLESGSSSQAELQGFQYAVDIQQLALDRAKEDLAYYKQLFTRLVGVESIDDQTIPAELPHPEYSAGTADAILAGFVGNGIESTFQSQVYEMTLKQQDLNYAIQKVRLYPKFYASAGLSFSNNVQPQPNGTVTQTAIQTTAYSLAATWAIFDGFATKGAKMSALATKRLYEREKKTYVDTTVDTIAYQRHLLDFTSRSMTMAERSYILLADQVRRLNEDLKLGYASQSTIDKGILTSYATEAEMITARSEYLSRWTEFVSLAGLDPAMDNLPVRYVR